MAASDDNRAGRTSRNASVPRSTSRAKSAPPTGTPVGGRHAGAGPAGDEQTPLLVAEPTEPREQVGRDRASLLRGAFAAERCPEPDDDDRQDRGAERAQCREPTGLEPDRGREIDTVAAAEADQRHLGDAGKKPRTQQQREVPRWRRSTRRVEQAGAGRTRPGAVLHGLE